jgi:hypothetical protein
MILPPSFPNLKYPFPLPLTFVGFLISSLYNSLSPSLISYLCINKVIAPSIFSLAPYPAIVRCPANGHLLLGPDGVAFIERRSFLVILYLICDDPTTLLRCMRVYGIFSFFYLILFLYEWFQNSSFNIVESPLGYVVIFLNLSVDVLFVINNLLNL